MFFFLPSIAEVSDEKDTMVGYDVTNFIQVIDHFDLLTLVYRRKVSFIKSILEVKTTVYAVSTEGE